MGILLSSAAVAMPDTYEAVKRESRQDSPRFAVRMFNAASDSADLSRLTVQLSFVYDALQFVKIGKNAFQANYSVTVTLMDTASGLEQAKEEWSESVEVDSFDKGNSTTEVVSTVGEVLVGPGDYLARIDLLDKETRRSGTEEGRVTARNFVGGSLVASDIIFLNSISFLGGDTERQVMEDERSLYAYLEIYNVPLDDSVDIAFTAESIAGDLLMQDEKRVAGSGSILKQHFELPSEARDSGNFAVTIEVKHNAEQLVRKQRLRPATPAPANAFENLNDAIEKLLHVASDKEIESMLALPEGDKLDAFESFWAKFDPTPETPGNEYRDEYYRRIVLAEREFKGYRPGWKTERGLVLVKIGQPNYINRPHVRDFDPMGRERAREVWEYTMLNRRVIFEVVHDEYRILNRIDIFDLLSRDGIRL